MLLNSEWIKNEGEDKSKEILETNENEHRRVENLWKTAKTVLRGQFIAI